MYSLYSVLLSAEFVKAKMGTLSKKTEKDGFPFQSLWKPKKFRYFSVSLLTKIRGYVTIKYKLRRKVREVFFLFLNGQTQSITFLYAGRAGVSRFPAV